MCSRKKVIKLLELKTEDIIVAHANLFTSGKTERLRLSLLALSSYFFLFGTGS